MTQEAVVNRIINERTAEIRVARTTACGGSCAACGLCANIGKPVYASAGNDVGAKAGDRVLVSSGTPLILKFASIFYILPFALLFTFYFMASAVFRIQNETFGMLAGAVGFALGILCAFMQNRAAKKADIFRIEYIIGPASGYTENH